MYTPNNKLYMKLFLFFGIPTILLLVLLGIFSSRDTAVAFISCTISILGGIFASIVVSWLIDVSSCNKKNQALESKKTKNINYINSALDSLFESCANTCQSIECNDTGTWEYWISTMKDNNFFKNDPNFYNIQLCVYVELNSLLNLLDESNSGDLKEYYLDTDNDLFFELQLLKTACENLRQIIFLNSNQNVNHIIFQFKDVLSTILIFSHLDDKVYNKNLNV